MAMRRKRRAFSLVEAVIAMLVMSIAIFAVVEVFTTSLRITVESALDSGKIISTYSEFQRVFSEESNGDHLHDFSISFKLSEDVSVVVPLKRYDFGDGPRARLPIYRLSK